MEQENDPKLRELLKEWQLPGAPPSLDARVLGPRRKWWSFLLTGSIRVPVPLMAVIAVVLLVMGLALLRQRAAPPPTPVNLAGFQPARDLNVRVIRGHYDAR